MAKIFKNVLDGWIRIIKSLQVVFWNELQIKNYARHKAMSPTRNVSRSDMILALGITRCDSHHMISKQSKTIVDLYVLLRFLLKFYPLRVAFFDVNTYFFCQ